MDTVSTTISLPFSSAINGLIDELSAVTLMIPLFFSLKYSSIKYSTALAEDFLLLPNIEIAFFVKSIIKASSDSFCESLTALTLVTLRDAPTKMRFSILAASLSDKTDNVMPYFSSMALESLFALATNDASAFSGYTITYSPRSAYSGVSSLWNSIK